MFANTARTGSGGQGPAAEGRGGQPRTDGPERRGAPCGGMGGGDDDRDHGGDEEDFGQSAEAERDRGKRPIDRTKAGRTFYTTRS